LYNLHSNPPKVPGVCDLCGGALVTRSDDDETTLRHRFQVYRKSTEPLVERYRKSGVPFHRLDGLGSVDEIQSRLVGALGIGAA
jgi:adenylate kinase